MNKKVIFGIILMFLAFSISASAEDLVKLVPDGSAFVVNINLAKIFSSQAIQKQIDEGLKKQTPEQKKNYLEFIEKTGIDPLKNITQICMFVSPQDNASDGKPQGGVFVTGSFNIAKILGAIKADPAASKDTEVTKFEGLDAIKGKKDPNSIGVFLDNSTAVIGNSDAVKDVIGVKGGKGKNLLANPTLAGIMKKVDQGSAVFGVGLIPQSLKDKAKENPQAAPLAAINALHFAFNYEPNLTFDFTGEVDKKESMEGVMTAIQGFVAMVKMMAAQQPEAGEILNLIKVNSAETTVKISLDVPKAKLEEIRKKVEEKMKKAAPEGK